MNIGIIGTGSIVENFMKAAREIDGINLSAIYSRNEENPRVPFLMEKYNLELSYFNYEQMLGNPNIDWIYVASPNGLHYEHSLKALQAGKNVICEKPFTSTYKEAKELVNTAKEKNLMILEAIITIYLPNYKIIKENLSKLGNIRLIQLNYSQYSSKYDDFLAGKNPNVFNPELSGGCFQDINIYNVHFMTGLFGFPEKFAYFPNIRENGIDTSGIMIMNYEGFTASLVASKDSRGENFACIQGENGYIYVKNGANSCHEIGVNIQGEEKLSLNIQNQTNGIYYELKEFSQMYKNSDFEKAHCLAEYSANVVKTVEKARLDAGIIFPADKN